MIGDGFCNDETNHPGCNYDGGDCCIYSPNNEKCSECACYHLETCNVGTHPLVGDGFCNDETNNVECKYDGFDCCGSNINTDFCSDCTCHGITYLLP